MKKKFTKISTLSCLFGLSISIYAQTYIAKKITDKNSNISLVTFKKDSNLKSASKINLFKDILKLQDGAELRLVKSEKDELEKFLDESYQLYYNNVKVEFGIYKLHYKNDNLTSMNGEIFKTSNISLIPKISSEAALSNALHNIGAEKYMWNDAKSNVDNYKKPSGELVLLPLQQSDQSYKLLLAYKFDIFASKPISRAYVYVDAINGEILMTDAIIKHASRNISKSQSEIKHPTEKVKDLNSKKLATNLETGNAATRYSGNQTIKTSLSESGNDYILFDKTRGNGIRTYNLKQEYSIDNASDFTDKDNNWTEEEFNNSTYDNSALDAHFGAEKTYDYFKDYHNRNSYDNEGTLLRSYVHYGEDVSNAFWSGSYMLYGDGDRTETFNVLTAFDITAHEIGHGVCQATANLAYQRESGALNEGLSDIWGSVVEHTYLPQKKAFELGEDITLYSPHYLRSMSDPKSAGQPNTYRGENWIAATAEEGCANPNSFNDYCGVHMNSGVLNHWFYILVVGKSGTNDNKKTYNVKGIGFEKASKITYRLEAAYLSANSDFINSRNLAIQVAEELYGEKSPEAIATQDAFHAVGVGTKYNPNGIDTNAPTTPSNLKAESTTNSSTYLTWSESTDDFALDGYNIYKDDVLIKTTYETSYYVTGLNNSTTYNFKVEAKDEADNKSHYSNIVPVTTLENGNTYCESSSYNTSFAKIQNVKLNSIDHNSLGNFGYEDFSYLSTDVIKGQSYTISITPYWSGSKIPLYYKVYADYNNNGQFTDSDETIWTQNKPTNESTISGTFTVPTTAYLGKVRLRIQAAYNEKNLNPCLNITYGQVEDYSLNISENLSVLDSKKHKTVNIYPNPVKDFINIQSKDFKEFDYKIFNINGQIISSGKSNDTKISTQNLVSGNYILELNTKDGVTTTHKFIKI